MSLPGYFAVSLGPRASVTIPANQGGAGYTGKLSIRGGVFVNVTQGASNYATLQLRGHNLSGYEDSAIFGINAPDASGGTNNFDAANGPNLTTMATWRPNCIRIPINEASWLGYNVYDATANGTGTAGWHSTTLGNLNGTSAAGATYQQGIINQIAVAQSYGIYSIVDLHFTAPGLSAPVGQDSMANQDHSIQFWQSISAVLGYPNGTAVTTNGHTISLAGIAFESFNEPYLGNWTQIMQGGFINYYHNYSAAGFLGGYQYVYPYFLSAQSGTFAPGEAFTSTNPTGVSGIIHAPPYTNTTTGLSGSGLTSIMLRNSTSGTSGFTGQGSIIVGTVIKGTTSGATATISNATYGWHIAGHQQIINAVRAAGAWNPILISGITYNSDLSAWAANAPTDNVAPTGYSGPGWQPQIAACWHPYPQPSTCTAAVVHSGGGGTGYAVGNTITLPIPVNGAYANSVWGTAVVLTVSSVSGGVITGVTVTNAGKYGPLNFQSSAVPQASTSGSGTGATFDLTIPPQSISWATVAHQTNVQALQSTPGVPVVITEIGDYWNYAEAGLTGAPWFSNFAAWCDTYNIGMIPWSYNPAYVTAGSGSGTIYVIANNGTPTPGYGATVFSWMSNHAP